MADSHALPADATIQACANAATVLVDKTRKYFGNRIDEVVIFNPLRKDDIKTIIDLQIEIIQKRLEEEHGITLDIPDRPGQPAEGVVWHVDPFKPDAGYAARIGSVLGLTGSGVLGELTHWYSVRRSARR